MRKLALALATLSLTASPIAVQAQSATAPVSRVEIARIIDEGTTDSEVMRIAQYLTDVIGPRLTNSAGMRHAEDWTQAKFREWGLTNVHKEGFDFGRGWSVDHLSVRMVAPRAVDLTASQIAWTPGIEGSVRGEAMLAPMADEAAFAQYKGKLRGKLVLVSDPGEPSDLTDAPFRRLNDADLAKTDFYELANGKPRPARPNRAGFAKARDAFLKAEGAIGWATMSSRPGKLVHGSGSTFAIGDTPSLPGFELAQEDYRRLVRLAAMGAAPTVELTSNARFDDSDPKAYNILADIPGSDAKAGYVMAGAHLDSWYTADGATDNGAGSAMIMEAARILKAIGAKPKRTIRFALWSGEEQGLLGSMSYIENHVASRPVDPGATGFQRYMTWSRGFPIKPQADFNKLAAYFNLDNGSGKIRGVYTQGNPGAAPIFEEWLQPFHAMGATEVAMRDTGSTDHQFFDAVGIPAFQFIQDPLDYGSTTHHSSADTFDHLRADDLRQGAIILAAFLLQAADSDKPLPRRPMPTAPKPSDQFYAAPKGATE